MVKATRLEKVISSQAWALIVCGKAQFWWQHICVNECLDWTQNHNRRYMTDLNTNTLFLEKILGNVKISTNVYASNGNHRKRLCLWFPTIDCSLIVRIVYVGCGIIAASDKIALKLYISQPNAFENMLVPWSRVIRESPSFMIWKVTRVENIIVFETDIKHMPIWIVGWLVGC